MAFITQEKKNLLNLFICGKWLNALQDLIQFALVSAVYKKVFIYCNQENRTYHNKFWKWNLEHFLIDIVVCRLSTIIQHRDTVQIVCFEHEYDYM